MDAGGLHRVVRGHHGEPVGADRPPRLVGRGGTQQPTKTKEINLQKNADGIYYDCYYSALLANGNTQEWSIPLCKLKVGYVLDLKPGERILGMEVHALAPVAAFMRTPAAFNVVALVPYTLTEGAVANGVPTDTASTLAAAVL